MDIARFKHLLSAYGAAIERWPEEERNAAREFIESNPETNALLREAALLDQALDAYKAESINTIREDILARLPDRTRRGLLDRFIDWLLPDLGYMGAWLWRPALLASVALILGIVLGSTLSLDPANDAGVWQEELHVMALNSEDMEPTQ